MKVSIRQFKALRPLVEPDLLAPGEATIASNCVVKSGALVPLRAPAPVMTLPGVQPISIYRFGQQLSSDTQHWFQFHYDADIVKGPVDNDTEERTYITGAVIPPYKTNAVIGTAGSPLPSQVYEMGVWPPTTPPLLAALGTPTSTDVSPEARVYCYTLVTGWGEESAPSPVSSIVSVYPGQSVNVSDLNASIPSGAFNYASKRIYRSVTGSASTQFQFVAEVPLATVNIFDSATSSQLGGVLVTRGWAPPPPTLRGLTAMANGIMAGFTGNTLCFSVPYVPYAWPVAYQLSVDAPIVGIAAFDQSLFVGTTTGVYIATGADPSAMSMEKLAIKQSCVAKRSIVPMMGGVVWASPDGLCYVGNSGFRLLTEDLISRKEWQTNAPASFSSFEHDGKYIAFLFNGAFAALIFDLGSTPTLTTANLATYGGYRDPKGDALFLAQPGNLLSKFGEGDPMALTWRSGIIKTPHDRPWSCARVVADSYPVLFSWITDSGVFTHNVTSRFAFRLPPGRVAHFQVEVHGATTIREIAMADSMQAMAEDG